MMSRKRNKEADVETKNDDIRNGKMLDVVVPLERYWLNQVFWLRIELISLRPAELIRTDYYYYYY